MMRSAVAAAIACAVSGLVLVVSAEERHTMTGVVLSIDLPARSMMVSTDAVPGFMAAMAMPVDVRDAAALEKLKPGSRIEFVYVGDGKTWHAESVRILGVESLDRKQLEVQRLKVLSGIANPAATAQAVPVGRRIPDFTLTDQVRTAGHAVDLCREGRRADVRICALSEPGVLLPARQQPRTGSEAAQGSCWARPDSADHRPGPRTRPATVPA